MKRFGLPKTNLLRKTGEFNQVYRHGKRVHGNGFSLISLAGDQPWSRLGISVPRKVGNAVRRNRIKRVVRETFRLHRALFPQSSDIVITVRPEFSLKGVPAFRIAVAGLNETAVKC